jgi:hypothetical protein
LALFGEIRPVLSNVTNNSQRFLEEDLAYLAEGELFESARSSLMSIQRNVRELRGLESALIQLEERYKLLLRTVRFSL